MSFNRRKFLKAGAMAAPAALAAPAYAQGKRKLQMVMSWPHNFPGLASMAYQFSEFLEQMTDGELTQLENFGIVAPNESGGTPLYGEDAVEIAKTSCEFLRAGVDATEVGVVDGVPEPDAAVRRAAPPRGQKPVLVGATKRSP